MTSVIKADLNLTNLKFSSVFRPTECTDISKQIEYFRYFNGHQTGGRLVWLDDKIYLTIAITILGSMFRMIKVSLEKS